MNYIKAALGEKNPKLRTVRGTVIRNFILKCFEKKSKKVSVNISMGVRDELKNWRQFYRKEFFKRGIHQKFIGRILTAAEGKFKKLFDGNKIIVHTNLSSVRIDEVEAFYRKYEYDNRLIKLRDEKNKRNNTNYITTLPGVSDINIFAQALNLPNLVFTTTDDHFYVLVDELEKKFNVFIIHDENAYKKMNAWDWF